MDVDDFLSSSDLPDVAVDADDALARTLRRGRARRLRRVAGASVGSALVLCLVAVTLNATEHDETGVSTGVSTGPTLGPALSHDPEAGDAAVWTTDPQALPSSSASTFTALVSRLSCSSGVTGRVLQPGVVVSDTEVVITFTVEALDPLAAYTCLGNDQVPYQVELGRPLGDRSLRDGSCQPGGAAESTAFCVGDGGVRWSPVTSSPAVAQPHACEAEAGSVLDVAHEPDWRQFAPYLPWTDRDGCLLRIDVVAERPLPAHCFSESARELIVGQPLGTRYTTPADTAEFIRDPDGVYGQPDLTAGFDPDATLPDGAVDTGYRRGDLALWQVPGDQAFIWVVSRDHVERWPAGDPPLCF